MGQGAIGAVAMPPAGTELGRKTAIHHQRAATKQKAPPIKPLMTGRKTIVGEGIGALSAKPTNVHMSGAMDAYTNAAPVV